MCVLPACAPCGCWELNPHLQEQVHLASETSLQLTFFFFSFTLSHAFHDYKVPASLPSAGCFIPCLISLIDTGYISSRIYLLQDWEMAQYVRALVLQARGSEFESPSYM